MRADSLHPEILKADFPALRKKAWRRYRKSGHRPIQGVLEYCDRIDGRKGLWIKDAGREPEIL